MHQKYRPKTNCLGTCQDPLAHFFFYQWPLLTHKWQVEWTNGQVTKSTKKKNSGELIFFVYKHPKTIGMLFYFDMCQYWPISDAFLQQVIKWTKQPQNIFFGPNCSFWLKTSWNNFRCSFFLYQPFTSDTDVTYCWTADQMALKKYIRFHQQNTYVYFYLSNIIYFFDLIFFKYLKTGWNMISLIRDHSRPRCDVRNWENDYFHPILVSAYSMLVSLLIQY
jgi:hypothetical protein